MKKKQTNNIFIQSKSNLFHGRYSRAVIKDPESAVDLGDGLKPILQ